jgi:CDP-diacylglycerol--glycerol-3-phosphate 3-phosphatidyltransferase
MIIKPVVPVLAKTGLTPNSLTFFGLILAAVAAAAIATDRLLLGGILVLVSGVFDLFDGALARVTRGPSKFGALLDSVADRFGEAILLFGLLLLYIRQGSSAGTEILLIFAAMVGSFLVSYVRARAEGLGFECKVGWFTRTERVILLALGLMLNQVLVALIILAAISYFTVGQRVIYIWLKGESRVP